MTLEMRLPIAAAVVLLTVALGAPHHAGAEETALVPQGAVWKYLDDGSDPGSSWVSAAFDDTGWASGSAQLGYGDGDEATVVGFGPDASNRFITTYFRHHFQVEAALAPGRLDLRLLRDDGAVVYLNGAEVFRSNLPDGGIAHTTLASSNAEGAEEGAFLAVGLDPALLVEGANLIAVEVHQASAASVDLSFDLELVASESAPRVTRGPYLQMVTPGAVTVRWRTDVPTDSRVRFGSSPATLDSAADERSVTTEHEVRITGLDPDTRYFYGIGSTWRVLAGADADHFFTTSPPPGAAKDTRIWVLGDSGTADASAAAVRDGYMAFTASRRTDLWLMLGDNAYDDGTDAQYQAAVFDMYPEFLRNAVLWPTLGNHDGRNATSATESGPYYDIFTLPRQGEAGGVLSGTEAYYSFDYANIHFICLDSHDTDRSPGGAMLTWLEDDLIQTTADWVIAFWHHPPYSKGSHDSDDESRLVDMRENALPLLESYGVDLVLAGHSHSYERSFLIDRHYGDSNSLEPSMILDAGDGRSDGDGPYQKATLAPAPHEGAVYIVAGVSGNAKRGRLDHPVMFMSVSQLGSLVLDIEGDTLDAHFIGVTGQVTDHFTLIKGAECLADPDCDDGLFCSGAETCQAHACVPGATPCDDAVACTVDMCDEVGRSCSHAPDDGLCDNGLFCDGAETCDAVQGCRLGADPCPGQRCDEASDACVECLADADCDDGVFCNGAETCQANVCAAGSDPCDDAVGCTVDGCDEVGQSCSHTRDDGLCDNGLFCDGAESCDAAQGCLAGADPCAEELCDEASDACVECLSDADCNDGVFCNGAETCQANVCAAGADPCDDRVGCTLDVCDDDGQSCSHAPDAGLCDNGAFCDGAEICDAVLGCLPAADPCAGEPCDEAADVCVECLADADCDDGVFCNGGETCQANVCAAGADPCDDGVGCTADACDEVGQSCSHAPDAGLCDNGAFCDGAEICDAVLGCLPAADPCAGEPCDEAADVCVECLADADCNDGVFCNGAESCQANLCAAGTAPCAGEPCDEAANVCVECLSDADCDDGVFCNGAEFCQGNLCAAGADPCDDGVGCTVDACDEVGQNCSHAPDAGLCDNGAFCDGVESCDAVEGCLVGAAPCAGEPCDEAADVCVECLSDADCNDGVFCNGGESCQANVCAAGADPCAGEPCDEAADVCVECLSDADCDDGVFCNGAEFCQANVCAAGADPCDDGVGCTVDACDEVGQSCSHAPDAGLCDNGAFCDGVESCDAVLDCRPGADPCAGELCDEAERICLKCLTDADCAEGHACNGASTCEAVAGPAQNRQQQKCILGLNAAGLRVVVAQAQQNRRCLRDRGRGRLQGSAEACVTTDPRGRVAKAAQRAVRADQRLCLPPGAMPDFAYADGLTASRAGRDAALDLLHDTFGDPLDDGLVSCAEDRSTCACQRRSQDQIDRLMVEMGKEFARCVRAQLKSGAATHVSGIEACVTDARLVGSVAADARRRIAKRRAQLLKVFAKTCAAVTVAPAAFGRGSCAQSTDSAAALAGCAVDRAECRFCLMAEATHGLALDCDGFDDGLANGSCLATE